jgi:prepilin-type N-terminal cleavage/methylation domain-containing protein
VTQINSRRRAMTLIEILVVVAIGLLVVGLVLEAMIGTNRATDELTAREGMRQEALLIAQSVEKVARYRVAPTELAPGAAAGVVEQFGPSQLRLCSLAYGADKDHLLQTVASAGGTSQAQHVIMRSSDGAEPDKAPAKRLGSNADRFKSDIAFRYASEYKDLEPIWSDQATSTPRLIEYTVRVWPNDPKMARFEVAQDSRGRNVGFRLTGAVTLP